MFTNLANYLLGSIINQDQGATAEGVENSSIRLTTEEQDDWVVVDRDSEGNSDTLSVQSLEDLECQQLDADLPPPRPLTRTSSSSSLPPYSSNMEDSWFITPPPCFTSAGPIHMETSPLENLLIEHPSMSVYFNYSGRRHVFVPVRTRTPSPSRSETEEDELRIEEDDIETGEQVAVIQIQAPRLNRLQVLQQQERQNFKSRRAQKAQMKKACEVLKRGTLQRNNKAREVNCRNRRQRRGERSQGANRSYANNNRKC
ncbi:hypothetical protein NQ315_004035 [Exocentrus adspersus]|uniref:Tumor protein p53-inducible nuclear protein 1 n=1 Tax=Exocentrus adspersus TaxID=1586481 RepID=A0AAV8W617_9CUCU|nr:hypothetical protein NQ315_004035 [Exocentrus adspersus]